MVLGSKTLHNSKIAATAIAKFQVYYIKIQLFKK